MDPPKPDFAIPYNKIAGTTVDKKIKSICGHVPIKTYAKEKNSFAWRPSVWGFGTWRRTWLECKQFMSKANKFNFNYKFKKKLLKHGHDLHIALGKNIIKKQHYR